ncbi:putative deoxyribonuclease YcfH [Methyloligella halotolerans]|uniref:Putative deoxyribonuclease YcfH n=1 Tax=Methyloligella halotolerans TaxID=1177755 RepID=A0A1E2S1M0_9HYPH|nr:TatD family hydrolase [Methyloligella halotolerans]ODA68403.1 putative deoxyribonuclease YcfH [Methyloligella halotolerans]
MHVIDSHCHLDFESLSEDRGGVLQRAADAGVDLMVTISTRVKRFDEILAIAEAHPNVFCSVGTHPHNADEELDVTAEDLVKLAEHPKVVAIGEAGLDYHYDNAPVAAQAQGFRTHIAAARESGLPLVIHAREADDDVAAILEEETAKGAFPFVLHCFTAGPDLARRGLALGGYLSASGVLTFKKSDALREIFAEAPIDRLLVETDAPYLSPEPHRGQTNEPSRVVHTAAKLAEVKGVSEDEIGRITSDNFFRLFSKVPREAAGAKAHAA